MKKLMVLLITILFSCNSKTNYSAIEIQNDYEKTLTLANEKDMKILFIFDRWGASNTVMSSIVYEYIKDGYLNGYVVATLFTDDKEIKEGDSISIGERNLKIEREVFGTEEYPMFFILNSKGKIIKGPQGYCSEEEFVKFILN